MELEELTQQYPRLYHMAESGTWDSIKTHGLLSTSALLDLFEISGPARTSIVSQHRPRAVEITHPRHGRAVIRDQKPMSESALRKCLDPDISPRKWFETLNHRVFFWLSAKRLNGLLDARAYRRRQHCVLTIETAALLRLHANQTQLSPINSGSTIFRPQPRGMETFSSIADYPFATWQRKRGRENAVVELVVDYSVPDIADHVLSVDERRAGQTVRNVYRRSDLA